MLYLLSSLPSHCCIWRVWSLWQVLPPWHEPSRVHVRLLFLQPGLCGLHRCSLMFIGALGELQHFIWSLGWFEWGEDIYGLRFHWKSHWLETVTLALGTSQCLPATCNSPAPKRFMNHCACWIMLRTCLLVLKCVEPCTQGFNVIPLPIPK